MTREEAKEKAKMVYSLAQEIDPFVALRLSLAADNQEEGNFFAYVGDMNLQRAQWNYILNEEKKQYQKQTTSEQEEIDK